MVSDFKLKPPKECRDHKNSKECKTPVVGELICPDFDSNQKLSNLVVFVLVPNFI